MKVILPILLKLLGFAVKYGGPYAVELTEASARIAAMALTNLTDSSLTKDQKTALYQSEMDSVHQILLEAEADGAMALSEMRGALTELAGEEAKSALGF